MPVLCVVFGHFSQIKGLGLLQGKNEPNLPSLRDQKSHNPPKWLNFEPFLAEKDPKKYTRKSPWN